VDGQKSKIDAFCQWTKTVDNLRERWMTVDKFSGAHQCQIEFGKTGRLDGIEYKIDVSALTRCSP
jgi:hypothetical protein